MNWNIIIADLTSAVHTTQHLCDHCNQPLKDPTLTTHPECKILGEYYDMSPDEGM